MTPPIRMLLYTVAAAVLLSWGVTRAPASPDLQLGRFECGVGEGFRLGFRFAPVPSLAMSLPLTSAAATTVCAAAASRRIPLGAALPRMVEGANLAGVMAVGGVLGGGPWALAAGALFAAVPPEFDLTPTCFSMPLSGLLLLMLSGLLAWREKIKDAPRTALAAAALGAHMMVRSTLALLPPLLAARELLSGGRRRAARRDAALLLGIPAAFVASWTLTNWLAFHRLIFFEDGRSIKNIAQSVLGLVLYVPGDISSLIRRADPTASEGGLTLGRIFRLLSAHPGPFLLAWAQRMTYIVGLHPALWALAAAGLWLHRRREDVRAAAPPVLYFALIHSLVAIRSTFLTPLTPLLAVFAGGTAIAALQTMRFSPTPDWIQKRAAPAALVSSLGATLAYCGLGLIWEPGLAAAARRGPLDSPQALSAALAGEPANHWLVNECLQRGMPPECAAARVEEVSARPGQYFEFEERLARFEALRGRPARLLLLKAPRLVPELAGAYRDDALRLDAFQAVALLDAGKTAAARKQLENLLGDGKRSCQDFAGVSVCDGPFWPGAAAEALVGLDPRSSSSFLNELLRLREARPPRDDERRAWIDIALKAGKTAVAAKLLENFPARSDANGAFELALLWQSAGRPERALIIIDGALKKSPRSASLLVEKAICQVALEKSGDAETTLRGAIAAHAGLLPAYVTLAAVLLNRKDKDGALKIYDAALAQPSALEDRPLREMMTRDREALSTP